MTGPGSSPQREWPAAMVSSVMRKRQFEYLTLNYSFIIYLTDFYPAYLGCGVLGNSPDIATYRDRYMDWCTAFKSERLARDWGGQPRRFSVRWDTKMEWEGKEESALSQPPSVHVWIEAWRLRFGAQRSNSTARWALNCQNKNLCHPKTSLKLLVK